jgi:RNA-directed DNA polymerase
MNSSQYRKSQLKFLCATIGCKPEELEYILAHVDDFYREWFEQKVNKSTGGYKTYKDGTVKQRAIRPSVKRLKTIQSAIKNKILARVPLPDNIHGGVKKRSNISNAKPHQGKKFQFTTDLQEFYPSVKNDRVHRMFLGLGYSDHAANWLTKLTTWKYELPQGTPTSTHIANLVFLAIDKKLIALCERHGLTYTRYVDDLTFSSQEDFRPVTNEILDIISDGGFNISYRKTAYKGNQTVTGIEIFNNYIDAPEKMKVKAKAEETSESKSKPYKNYVAAIRRTNDKRNKTLSTIQHAEKEG